MESRCYCFSSWLGTCFENECLELACWMVKAGRLSTCWIVKAVELSKLASYILRSFRLLNKRCRFLCNWREQDLGFGIEGIKQKRHLIGIEGFEETQQELVKVDVCIKRSLIRLFSSKVGACAHKARNSSVLIGSCWTLYSQSFLRATSMLPTPGSCRQACCTACWLSGVFWNYCWNILVVSVCLLWGVVARFRKKLWRQWSKKKFCHLVCDSRIQKEEILADFSSMIFFVTPNLEPKCGQSPPWFRS